MKNKLNYLRLVRIGLRTILMNNKIKRPSCLKNKNEYQMLANIRDITIEIENITKQNWLTIASTQVFKELNQ